MSNLEEVITEALVLVLNKWSIIVAGGIFLSLRTLSSVRWLNRNQAYRRGLPFLPEAFGITAAFFGGFPPVDGMPWPIKVAAGVWCAYFAKNFRAFLKRTIVGHDKLIKGKKTLAEVAAEELDDEELKHGE